MIGVKIRGEWLDLFPNTTLSFDLNNPAYLGDDVDVIQGAFSFPADIPLTPTNRKTLDNPQRLDSTALFVKDEPAEVWAEGSMLFPALATITEAGKGSARMTLLVGWISKLKDVALNELDLGGIVTMGANLTATLNHAKATALNPLDYDYVFYPIQNPAIIDDSDADTNTVGNWQNRFDAAGGAFYHEPNDVAMPFLRLDFVLEKLFSAGGFALKNKWQTTDELRLLTIYNNYNITNIATGGWSFSFDPKNHISKTKGGDYLKKLARLFNLGVFVNYFDKTAELIPLEGLLERAAQHDWTGKAVDNYTVSQTKNYPTRFGYESLYDELAYYLGWKDSPLENGIPSWVLGEVDDLNALTTADAQGYYLEKTTNLIAEWFPLAGSPYFAGRTKYMPVINDSDDVKYVAGISTGWLRDLDPITPQVKVKGTVGIEKNDCPDKLFFYRGMQKNADDDDYPMGDTMGFKLNKTVLSVEGSPAEYSLYWDRERGLYNRWWKNWHYFLKNKRDVKRQFALTVRDVRNFSFADKVRVDNQNYFVKKLHLTLSQRGLEMTEAELVSVT